MEHLQAFLPREILPLPLFSRNGWLLKRYAIIASGRNFDDAVASAAALEAIKRLPKAGQITAEDDNHGVGFQIVHFADTAVVSPVFYWQWGSVLAHIGQLRAPWTRPAEFDDGVGEVVGCIWEMEIVQYEMEAWKAAMLADQRAPEERLTKYLRLQAT